MDEAVVGAVGAVCMCISQGKIGAELMYINFVAIAHRVLNSKRSSNPSKHVLDKFIYRNLNQQVLGPSA